MPAFLYPLEINSYWLTKNKCDLDPVFLVLLIRYKE